MKDIIGQQSLRVWTWFLETDPHTFTKTQLLVSPNSWSIDPRKVIIVHPTLRVAAVIRCMVPDRIGEAPGNPSFSCGRKGATFRLVCSAWTVGTHQSPRQCETSISSERWVEYMRALLTQTVWTTCRFSSFAASQRLIDSKQKVSGQCQCAQRVPVSWNLGTAQKETDFLTTNKN